MDPTADPTIDPTVDPTADPTIDPTADPTADPTIDPTADPTVDPTVDPTSDPTAYPSQDPTLEPTNDPTADPTVDPTVDPTTDPTVDPTADPTTDPTEDPTADPTVDPTADPTKNPTYMPTISPIVGVCDELSTNLDRKLDVIILVDNSVGLGYNSKIRCGRQQEFIAEIISSFKGAQEADSDYAEGDPTQVRVGYYIFGTTDTPSNIQATNLDLDDSDTFVRLIGLDDEQLNAIPSDAFYNGLYERVRRMDCSNITDSSTETTDLYSALDDAIIHFNDVDTNDDDRDKKIIIYSARANTNGDICTDFMDRLNQVLALM